MKKIYPLIIFSLLVLFLVSCSTQQGAQNGEASASEEELITSAEIDLTAAKLELVPAEKTVRAGEQLTVTLKLSDCVWFTGMTLHIAFPEESLQFVSGETLFTVSDAYDAVNAENGILKYSLMVQNAETLNGESAVFTFKVSDSVQAGTVLNFDFTPDTVYSAATDALGVNVENLSDSISKISCSVTVE